MTQLNSNTSASASDNSIKRAASSSAKGYCYGDTFYRYIEAGSIRSARTVVPLVLKKLSPASVLDVGCGAGAWLSEYHNCGIDDYWGLDGEYVQTSSLLIPPEHFRGLDIGQAFNLGRRFDLVQCLEVAEHLPYASSGTLIENLIQHGDMILFSAATPGQGGENHINEQTHEFWRLLFSKHGYKPFDPFRPMIKGVATVESWYRYNLVLYVAEAAIPSLPTDVRYSGIRDDQAIPKMAPFLNKIQAGVLSLLPIQWASMVALVKHHIVIACRSLRED